MAIEWRTVIEGDHCFAGDRTFDSEQDAVGRARTHDGYVERREVGPWERVCDYREARDD